MKREFETVEIEIVLFSTDDVITASGDPIVGGDDDLTSSVMIGL